MITSYVLTVDDKTRNELEADFYETETAARNAVFALSRAGANEDKFSSAFAFQWERLVRFAKSYEDRKDLLSDNVVKPDLKKKGILANVNWNLDFESKEVTVTYDDEAEVKEAENVVEVDCPDDLVNAVSSVSYILNAYDTIMGYISRNNGAGLDDKTVDELGQRQAKAYKEFIKARNNIETQIVMPYLQENNIEDQVNWELKYSTKKITINY